MVDKASESEDMNSQTPTPDRSSSSDGKLVKTCVDCGTSRTPLWRGGPAGPKSLCNACGIRSRKKRRALMGVNKEDMKSKKSSSRKNISCNESSTGSIGDSTGSGSGGSSSKKRVGDSLWVFGRDVGLQRPRSNTAQKRKLGEEEQAAFLLMALSCGSVYA